MFTLHTFFVLIGQKEIEKVASLPIKSKSFFFLNLMFIHHCEVQQVSYIQIVHTKSNTGLDIYVRDGLRMVLYTDGKSRS